MSFGQSLILALVPTLGVLAAFVTATRDLRLKRRLDSTDRFLEIASIANGRPRDSRGTVGEAEQSAALWLLVNFGQSEKHLKDAAIAALRQSQNLDMAKPHLGRSPVVGEASHALSVLESTSWWRSVWRGRFG